MSWIVKIQSTYHSKINVNGIFKNRFLNYHSRLTKTLRLTYLHLFSKILLEFIKHHSYFYFFLGEVEYFSQCFVKSQSKKLYWSYHVTNLKAILRCLEFSIYFLHLRELRSKLSILFTFLINCLRNVLLGKHQ